MVTARSLNRLLLISCILTIILSSISLAAQNPVGIWKLDEGSGDSGLRLVRRRPHGHLVEWHSMVKGGQHMDRVERWIASRLRNHSIARSDWQQGR